MERPRQAIPAKRQSPAPTGPGTRAMRKAHRWREGQAKALLPREFHRKVSTPREYPTASVPRQQAFVPASASDRKKRTPVLPKR
ncbi:MAG: hypothetical protein D6741_15850 [Planctomycetota bacterium]|nr:MAG: hypothetical protein D6741_15850 [Planctomycetota bacterium]